MEAVLDFIHQFKTVTGADLKLMYSLSSEELEALVQKLVSAGAVSVETSAQGEFIHEAAGLHCENGTCSLFRSVSVGTLSSCRIRFCALNLPSIV